MAFTQGNIVSVHDLSKEDLLHILKVAKDMEENVEKDLLKDKILATIFYEPSTRTRLSFVSAMEQLGGEVLGFSKAATSSAKKGESLWDTMKVVEGYADGIVIRHPLEGSARLASEATEIPVLNAGDGSNQHPTQTLLDLYTIQKEKEDLEDLKVGILGDLKYGRTVHSLISAMSYFNPEFYFVAPDALQLPSQYLEELDKESIPYTLEEDLNKVISELDVLYVTRIQEERFADPQEYERYKGTYQIDKSILPKAKKDLKILHPLPRVDEISPELDDTKHAVYFSQAANGVHVRKALLATLLGDIE